MVGSTIRSKLGFGVTVDSVAYPSPMTIADTGAIVPAPFGATRLARSLGVALHRVVASQDARSRTMAGMTER